MCVIIVAALQVSGDTKLSSYCLIRPSHACSFSWKGNNAKPTTHSIQPLRFRLIVTGKRSAPNRSESRIQIFPARSWHKPLSSIAVSQLVHRTCLVIEPIFVQPSFPCDNILLGKHRSSFSPTVVIFYSFHSWKQEKDMNLPMHHLSLAETRKDLDILDSWLL